MTEVFARRMDRWRLEVPRVSVESMLALLTGTDAPNHQRNVGPWAPIAHPVRVLHPDALSSVLMFKEAKGTITVRGFTIEIDSTSRNTFCIGVTGEPKLS